MTEHEKIVRRKEHDLPYFGFMGHPVVYGCPRGLHRDPARKRSSYFSFIEDCVYYCQYYRGQEDKTVWSGDIRNEESTVLCAAPRNCKKEIDEATLAEEAKEYVEDPSDWPWCFDTYEEYLERKNKRSKAISSKKKAPVRQYDPERNCQDEYAQYLSGVITYDIWHKYYDGLPIGMTKYGKVLNPEYETFVWRCIDRMFPDAFVWDEQTLMLYINYKGDLDYFTVIVGTPKGRARLNVPYNPFEIWGIGKACPVYPKQWHMNKMDLLNHVLDYFRLFCDGDICKLDVKIRNERSDEWNDVTGRIIAITGNTFTSACRA